MYFVLLLVQSVGLGISVGFGMVSVADGNLHTAAIEFAIAAFLLPSAVMVAVVTAKKGF